MSNNRVEEGTGSNEDTGGSGTSIVSARTDANRVLLRSEEQSLQLIPGLPDEITLNLITPKLPWQAIICALSSVSRAWRSVIRSRQVYDARVRSNSTEKFVLHPCGVSSFPRWITPIGLYSVREKRCYALPPIHILVGEFRSKSRCIAFHGKIYILGGVDELHMGTKMGFDVGCAEVYVLDLFAERRWKRCAYMQACRKYFGCGVLDGKIYVFGGFRINDPLSESEVYDPEVDAWLAIKPSPSMRVHHQVATLGGELLSYGGSFYEDIYERGETGEPRLVKILLGDALFLELYNPITDEWRRIESFKGGIRGRVFVAYGKIHSITQLAIHVYDIEKKSWLLLHTCSFSGIAPTTSVKVYPVFIVAVDYELLVRVWRYNTDNHTMGSCLLESKGFGSESKEIVWEKVEGFDCFHHSEGHHSDFMSLMEL